MTAIRFENVSKKYKLYSKGGLYLRDRITQALQSLNPFNGGQHSALSDPQSVVGSPSSVVASGPPPLERDFWALKNVSFQIKQGESVGFIGRNGAGKSTILKLLAGVTKPSSGNVEVNGRIAALIEVGAGFHPELTGRENVYLNGSILGMKKSEIEKQLDSIVAFAELEDFIDTPVKHYSSGMYVRLGFAVAAHTDPEIYLIDEVLAVGDEAFQKKCLDTLAAHKAAGKTMILVSHNLEKVAEVCQRCIYIDRGQVRYSGSPTDAIETYRNDLQEKNSESNGAQAAYGVDAKILGVIFRDGAGHVKESFNSGDDVIVEIQYQAIRRIESPVFGIGIGRTDNGLWGSVTSRDSSVVLDGIQGKGTIFCRINRLPFTAGMYLVGVAIRDSGNCTYDYHHSRYRLEIRRGDYRGNGPIHLSRDWSEDSSRLT